MKADKAPANTIGAKKPKKLPRKAVITIILLVVLATILFALLGYRAQQTRQREADAAFAADQARFARVEAEMEKAYQAMVAAAGKPDKTEQFKSCSHIAHKYEKGDLYCTTSRTLQYRESTTQASKQRISLVESAIRQDKTLSEQSTSTISESIQLSDDEQSAVKLYDKGDNVLCELNFELRRLNRQEAEGMAGEYQSRYVFKCSQKVTSPVYPLAE